MVRSRTRSLTDSAIRIDDDEEWSDGSRVGGHPRWRWVGNRQALGTPRQASSDDTFEQRSLDRFAFDQSRAELVAPEYDGLRLRSQLPVRPEFLPMAHFHRTA